MKKSCTRGRHRIAKTRRYFLFPTPPHSSPPVSVVGWCFETWTSWHGLNKVRQNGQRGRVGTRDSNNLDANEAILRDFAAGILVRVVLENHLLVRCPQLQFLHPRDDPELGVVIWHQRLLLPRIVVDTTTRQPHHHRSACLLRKWCVAPTVRWQCTIALLAAIRARPPTCPRPKLHTVLAASGPVLTCPKQQTAGETEATTDVQCWRARVRVARAVPMRCPPALRRQDQDDKGSEKKKGAPKKPTTSS